MRGWIGTNAGAKSRGGYLLRAGLMTWLLLSAALAGLAGPAKNPPVRSHIKYRTYFNERFQYVVSYPVHVLSPLGEPDNHDGQKFVSIHADAVLTVYGRYNALDESLASLYAAASRGGRGDAPKRVVTYRILKKDGLVVSGYDCNQIFYEKTVMSRDVIASLSFVYPARQKAYYDPIAAKIAGSFRQFH